MLELVVSRREALRAVPVAGAGLFLVGCPTGLNAVVVAVNAVVVAANLALNILEGVGVVPAPVLMLVQPYLANVGQAVIDTNMEVQSADAAAVKATKIAAIWARLAAGVALPGDTPVTIVNVIAEVVAAVKALLSIVGTGVAALGRAGAALQVYRLTRGDRHVLGQLAGQGLKIKARAMALK